MCKTMETNQGHMSKTDETDDFFLTEVGTPFPLPINTILDPPINFVPLNQPSILAVQLVQLTTFFYTNSPSALPTNLLKSIF